MTPALIPRDQNEDNILSVSTVSSFLNSQSLKETFMFE